MVQDEGERNTQERTRLDHAGSNASAANEPSHSMLQKKHAYRIMK
ncbi:hypothetical protein [Paenibacillus thiaminolyticus]|nr:hypothetical protein [Paenibacillus thiaminolyticus]WII37755.1 hypothetical protein O0V01_00900 [Paenibacillus thiaminolyticus]